MRAAVAFVLAPVVLGLLFVAACWGLTAVYAALNAGVGS